MKRHSQQGLKTAASIYVVAFGLNLYYFVLTGPVINAGSHAIPSWYYLTLMIITVLFWGLYLLEGLLLARNKPKKYLFYPGLILSVILLAEFPVNTFFGIISIYSLIRNRRALN